MIEPLDINGLKPLGNVDINAVKDRILVEGSFEIEGTGEFFDNTPSEINVCSILHQRGFATEEFVTYIFVIQASGKFSRNEIPEEADSEYPA
jgi:hypothetical protein